MKAYLAVVEHTDSTCDVLHYDEKPTIKQAAKDLQAGFGSTVWIHEIQQTDQYCVEAHDRYYFVG